MKKSTTPRQKELLQIIYDYIINEGYPPTFDEMRERLKVVSNQSVIDLLNKLEKNRIIKRNENIARSIAILPIGYEMLGKPPLAPFLGVSSAGAPINSIEITGEWQTLSSDIAKLKDEVFILKVSGDSMINSGIDDGDLVLVKTEKEFVSGNVVLVQINDEVTIKRFISDDNPPYIYLKPENPKYDIIPATDKMTLKGKVISVLKESYWRPVS
ncbi:repressor LexA [Candidatus Roizmanbacteria bacterium RIFCSPHIGHO2_01_FULL_35_10]|uniref:Repressor LexA n=1 Tax=Candidatus Roizmanbacteria bacterium RIFCSPLOWO2_01_FULL_35_13 TaxID=1802055 RepID=A0A1F7IAQ1_9BACT|nr:MAG: repressor LexA [Candidatus Roizmanbacteria bacterium RIFCSPHIGHO2_01_FULL_35_10]OGK40428.1 MAG: repressor LexA [Candidatus Roizmanbacteria bacterium RIFCSPLOWO2_01_FULL_35_13]